MAVAIVPIEFLWCLPLRSAARRSGLSGVIMRMMHLCYAAIGFAVARWLFKREVMPVVDPVTRFRSQGLL